MGQAPRNGASLSALRLALAYPGRDEGGWVNFHAYPMDDVLGARVNRSRLDRVERITMGKILRFVDADDRRVSLALSFGKDSMTCLHLAWKSGALKRMALVMFNHSGLETPDTEAMRDYVVDRYGIREIFAERWTPSTLMNRAICGNSRSNAWKSPGGGPWTDTTSTPLSSV